MQPFGPLLELSDHWIVLGVPKSGKSTLAKALVHRAWRVVYFDPHGDYDGLVGVEIIDPWDLTPEHLSGEHMRVVIPAERSEVDVGLEFNRVVSVCRQARDQGGLVLVADEVGDYNVKSDQTLKRLHRNGHKDGIVSVLVSQRAVDIPRGCRATANRVISLLQDNKDDLDALREWYGSDFAERTRAWVPGDPPVEWIRKDLWGTRDS